jgi:lipopolysaccharide assembly protein A
MTEPVSSHAAATTTSLPGPEVGAVPPAAPVSTQPRAAAHAAPRRRKMNSRISGAYTALIVGIVILVLVLIFVIQNAHPVGISFLGAHLHLSLAVALLLAAVAGAVVMAAAGTARITQLRQIMRRDRRASKAG